jgi:hypothetical protein
MVSPAAVTFVVVIDVPAQGRADFLNYERAVLTLLERHGGRLERRLRTPDGLTEVHIVSFRSNAGYQSYLGDPERNASRRLLGDVEIRQRLLPVVDVAGADAENGFS